MKYLKILITLVIFVYVNSSCINTDLSSNYPTETLSAPYASTSLPIYTPTVTSNFDNSCWEIKKFVENEIDGTLVYANYDITEIYKSLGKVNIFFALDLRSLHIQNIDVSAEVVIEDNKIISNKDIIYIISGNELIAISNEKIQKSTIPEEIAVKDLIIDSYLYDGRVLLRRTQRNIDSNEYEEGVGYTDLYYIFDPKTEEVSKHQLFLPNLYIDWTNIVKIKYSPDIKYVIYQTEPAQDGGERFILYNLETNEILWTLPAENSNLGNASGTMPNWVPNMNLIVGQYVDKNTKVSEYYYASLDGNLIPITNLGNEISLYNITNKDHSTNLSPNSQYLVAAGNQKNDTSPGNSIFIWDMENNIGYKPCLPNEENVIVPIYPIWSPNGNYFIANLSFKDESTSAVSSYILKSYILDLNNKIIYEMFDNLENPNNIETGGNKLLAWLNWSIP
jgi:hypothetical protein